VLHRMWTTGDRYVIVLWLNRSINHVATSKELCTGNRSTQRARQQWKGWQPLESVLSFIANLSVIQCLVSIILSIVYDTRILNLHDS